MSIYNFNIFTIYSDVHMALAVKTPENISLIQALKTKTWVRWDTWFAIIIKNEIKKCSNSLAQHQN